jgi:hypothetical protein
MFQRSKIVQRPGVTSRHGWWLQRRSRTASRVLIVAVSPAADDVPRPVAPGVGGGAAPAAAATPRVMPTSRPPKTTGLAHYTTGARQNRPARPVLTMLNVPFVLA